MNRSCVSLSSAVLNQSVPVVSQLKFDFCWKDEFFPDVIFLAELISWCFSDLMVVMWWCCFHCWCIQCFYQTLLTGCCSPSSSLLWSSASCIFNCTKGLFIKDRGVWESLTTNMSGTWSSKTKHWGSFEQPWGDLRLLHVLIYERREGWRSTVTSEEREICHQPITNHALIMCPSESLSACSPWEWDDQSISPRVLSNMPTQERERNEGSSEVIHPPAENQGGRGARCPFSEQL